MTVRHRIPRNAALDIVMLFQSANDIIKSVVVRIICFDFDNLPQLVFEALRTALFHLRFSEGQLVALF